MAAITTEGDDLTTTRRMVFARRVGMIADAYPISISSWWRSDACNKLKGGNERSFHLEGLGADILPDKESDRVPIVKLAHDLGLDAVDEGTHIHVELDYRRHPNA
jgi:hypothetical protein